MIAGHIDFQRNAINFFSLTLLQAEPKKLYQLLTTKKQ